MRVSSTNLILCVTTAGGLLWCVSCPAPRTGTEAFSTAPQLPSPRHGHQVHRIGNALFVIGGYSEGKADSSRQTWGYFPSRSGWTRLADMSVGKAFFGSAVIGGRLYAVGTNIERYDPARDLWEVVSLDETLPHSHFDTAAVNDVLYIVKDSVQAYDTRSGTLWRLPPLPGLNRGDHFHIVAGLDGALHVIGGLDGSTFEVKSDHWVLRSNHWQRLPDAPMPLFAKFAVTAVAQGDLYIFTHTHGWRYRPGKGWSERARLPAVVAMPGRYVDGPRLMVLGGLFVDSPSRRLVYDFPTDRWRDE